MFRCQAIPAGKVLYDELYLLLKAIGIALESMRLDVLEEAISKGDTPTLLSYVLESAMTIIQNLAFRNQVCFSPIIINFIGTSTTCCSIS